jgi:hypothetical protein
MSFIKSELTGAAVVMLSGSFAATGSAQLPALGSRWEIVLPGQHVYATADSISRIGADFFRAVVVTDIGSMRMIGTEEIHCARHEARTTRVRTVGPGAKRSDSRSVDDPFDKAYPGGPEDIKDQNVCALAKKKFTQGGR